MKISLTPSSFTRHLSSIIFRYHNHIQRYDCDSFYSDSNVRVTIVGGARPNSHQSGTFYVFHGLDAFFLAWNVGACLMIVIIFGMTEIYVLELMEGNAILVIPAVPLDLTLNVSQLALGALVLAYHL